MAATDALAVRFVTGLDLVAIEEDDVLDPADLWREGGGSA